MGKERKTRMAVKLKNDVKDDIPVSNLKENEIAVITQWGSHKSYIGYIVFLTYTDNGYILSQLGDINSYWENWESLTNDCRVRVLKPGTELVIE